MNTTRILASAVGVACTLALLGLASRARYEPSDGSVALLRMSWRVRGDKNEVCRQRTEEELERLPAHMRTPEVCTTESLVYALSVRLDDGTPSVVMIRPAGARADRPLFVLRDVTMTPGAHRVRIEFARAKEHSDDGDDHRDRSHDTVLAIDTVLRFVPGQIDLITVDPETGRFVVRLPRPGVATPLRDHRSRFSSEIRRTPKAYLT